VQDAAFECQEVSVETVSENQILLRIGSSQFRLGWGTCEKSLPPKGWCLVIDQLELGMLSKRRIWICTKSASADQLRRKINSLGMDKSGFIDWLNRVPNLVNSIIVITTTDVLQE
jgi:hypothetical protein